MWRKCKKEVLVPIYNKVIRECFRVLGNSCGICNVCTSMRSPPCVEEMQKGSLGIYNKGNTGMILIREFQGDG